MDLIYRLFQKKFIISQFNSNVTKMSLLLFGACLSIKAYWLFIDEFQRSIYNDLRKSFWILRHKQYLNIFLKTNYFCVFKN